MRMLLVCSSNSCLAVSFQQGPAILLELSFVFGESIFISPQKNLIKGTFYFLPLTFNAIYIVNEGITCADLVFNC